MPKVKKIFQAPKGMHDILPDRQPYWEKFRKAVRETAESFGFQRIDTPILEETDLFLRGTGATTDIVTKQMYNLKAKSGHCLSLRPEGTPGVVRAYLEQGMMSWPQPVKLYYFGPMFRYEQPQAGRYRQFYQIGFESLGDQRAVMDAQIIQVCLNLLKNLGLGKIIIQLNSIGCKICRPTFRRSLMDYYRYRKNRICFDCRHRLRENPLRLLDCKDEKCQQTKAQAPIAVDYLCDECRQHFKNVLEFMDELGVSYFLNNNIVRGLDYYTKTVFEFFLEEGGEKISLSSALGGGGRYDDLVEQLGGKATPAVGAALGADRIVGLICQEDLKSFSFAPKVFLVQLGEMAKRKGLRLFEELTEAGIKSAEALSRDSITAQLKIANRLGVQFTLILGQQEALEGTVAIRDMQSGVQETVRQSEIINELKKRFKK